MRTVVELPDEQIKSLDAYCHRKRISRAEAIRRAVGGMLKEMGHDALPHEAFGLWKKKNLNARKHIEKLRGEWKK